jgi:ATP-dependent DNA helicase DinG
MNDLRDIFGEDGPLAQVLPGFRPRHSQLQLAQRVAQTLSDRNWLVAEAGTGTGKTFAYLVPALLCGRRVIISTGTRTLQDQLFHRDLPLLNQALGRAVSVALLKGRANYLCRERWLRMPQQLPLEGDLSLPQSISAWAQRTVDGDLAELSELPDGHPLRDRITSTRDSCSGSRCAEFSRCHVFAARRRANEADLVVVNHHLLLADLALKEEGFGDILPSADAVILDEAHQLPELAAQFFGVTFSSRAVEVLLEDLPDLLLQSGFELTHLADNERSVRESLRRCLEAAKKAAGAAGRAGWEDWPALDAAATGLISALCALSDVLRALDAGDLLSQCALRAAELAGDLDAVAHASVSEGARLLSSTTRGFSCQLVPFNVGTKLRTILESRPTAWVFTSATLAVAGDFGHFTERLGLADRFESVCIDSPFDYPKQALLYLPVGMPDPSSAEYTDHVVLCAMELIEASAGGAFILFTSHRALEHAARKLKAHWLTTPNANYALLVQGEAPREKLLRDFRRLDRAVLLGTASFWEGVDVKGPALRLVVIDRLPFTSPDDPITRARVQHARSSGGNPFSEFQLPEAALALKQGVGRLIRSEEDEGVVAICDPRLTSKGYGKTLLAALPPMRRTRELAEVKEFLARIAESPEILQA